MRRGSRQERGSALIIALLVITIMAFLGGVLLLMSQGETQISSNMRQTTAAFTAAEAGLETILNQLPQLTAVSCTNCDTPPLSLCLNPVTCPGITFRSAAGKTLGQTTAQPITPVGPQVSPAGYNLANTQSNGYLIYSTGVSTTFLFFVNQMVELETTAVVTQLCYGTDYTC